MNKTVLYQQSKQATILILTDCLSYIFSVSSGLGIGELLKHLFLPEIPAITQSTIMQDTPVAFGLPLIFLLIINFYSGHYNRHRLFWDDYYHAFKNIVITAIVVILYFYLTKDHFSRMWFFSTWILMLFIIPTGRLISKKAMIRSGLWLIPTVIVGGGKNAFETATAVESDKLLGFNVIGFIVLKGDDHDISYNSSPTYRFKDDIFPLLNELNNPYVVVALDELEYNHYATIIEKLAANYISLSIVPSVRRLPIIGSELSYIFKHDIFLLRINNNLSKKNKRLIKRSFDIIVSTIFIITLLPLFILLFYKIRQDGGDAIFTQERIGKYGTTFPCYKFRSMTPNAAIALDDILANDANAQKEWNNFHKLKNDPRITPIGKYLRTTSLDELPQLWNVLKGDMSIVGPRPIVSEEISRYGDRIDYYYESWPGMTGLWQVSGRNDMDYEQRVNLDEWYARNWSLWYDIVIILKTIPVLLGRNGAY